MSSINATSLLDQHQLQLILLDLGASGGIYKPFDRVRANSCLIEVDPDDRDFVEASPGVPERITVREAIIGDKRSNTVDIHLTADAHCSSTLVPDVNRLQNFTYASLFEVKRSVTVPATSLDRLAQKLGRHFDWMKIDTQGSELEILQSMTGELLNRLLCCDAEISLYPHYLGAGTFPAFHDHMTQNGFQVANLVRVQSRTRMRKADLDAFQQAGGHPDALTRWPTSLELRYIRAISHDQPLPELPILLKLWAIANATDNHAYGYYLARRLEEDSPEDAMLARQLQKACVKASSRGVALTKKVRHKMVAVLDRILGGTS